MFAKPHLAVMLLAVAVVAGRWPRVTAVEAKPDKETSDRHAGSRRSVERIQATIEEDGSMVELPLQPGPLLSYREVVRGWNNGTSWVWGDRGRPKAFLNMSTLTGNNTRFFEFISLTNDEMLFQVDDGPTRWAPKPSWQPLPIPKTRRPTGNRRLRLVQIKQIARRFTAYQRDFFEDRTAGVRHELRLLPQPIYRYPNESDQSLDGALFAFTRNGDLEVLLTIEAAKPDQDHSEPHWLYLAQPVAVHELHLELDGQSVWELPNTSISSRASPAGSYFIHVRSAREDER